MRFEEVNKRDIQAGLKKSYVSVIRHVDVLLHEDAVDYFANRSPTGIQFNEVFFRRRSWRRIDQYAARGDSA
jgi:hypothetical protein